MDKIQMEIAIGGLLHDIGKVMYRYNDGRNHSTSGYEFLKEQGIKDEEILNQTRFHHAGMLKNANLKKDSTAYITYWADNVAAGADRKDKEESEDNSYKKYQPLESIFNVLNNNSQSYTYNMTEIYDSGEINYPVNGGGDYSETTYGKIVDNIKDGLKALELKEEYLNSLLCMLEANLSFVPSSTNTGQLADISLFDHTKITAAVGNCIYEYLIANGEEDFHEALYKNAALYYKKQCFLMYSMDISGIQDFIYTVNSKNALKTLRSKSFYLEIMLEHIIDELLEKMNLSRANLIYSGGGHAYMLLPNTDGSKKLLAEFETELNQWFLGTFQTELYIAAGYAECSANELMNKTINGESLENGKPANTYGEIFKRVSEKLSLKKSHRYSGADILKLNNSQKEQYQRECRVCGRVDHLEKELSIEGDSGDENADSGETVCSLCNSFIRLSSGILKKEFVTILQSAEGADESMGAILPFNCRMVLESEDELKKRMAGNESYKRAYSKNRMYTGYNVATRLWIGDYNAGNSFKDLIEDSKGIRRLGVLRADVDNLGQTFVHGFERENSESQYASLSRSATFSRKMSLFFKLHINNILENPKYSFYGDDAGEKTDAKGSPDAGENNNLPKRKAVIIYSGGDDLFIVGAWNHIVEAAVDIDRSLKKFTQGTLSISAGIGMYPDKYPILSMANETGLLEDASKDRTDKSGKRVKDAITLFEEGSTYGWDDFTKNVIGEKFKLINAYFNSQEDKGMSAVYKLMNYIRNRTEKINLARFAYMLGRMEPGEKAGDDIKSLYRNFTNHMYQWISGSDQESRELLTAIYIYVYLNRNAG